MAPKELPPELWARVIFFLERDTPPPWRDSDWMELHQADLASCMRVSPVFNKVTTPLLYRSPVVNNVELFFRGVGDDVGHVASDQTTSNSGPILFRTKLEAFGSVERINFFSDKPRLTPSYARLLAHGCWDIVGETKTERWKRKDMEAAFEFKSIEGTFDRMLRFESRRPGEKPILTRVKSVILGRGPQAWTYRRYEGDDRPYDPETAAQHANHINANIKVTDFVLRQNPTTICQYGVGSPFSLHVVAPNSTKPQFNRPQPPSSGGLPRPLIITHRSYDQPLMPLLEGATNRFIRPHFDDQLPYPACTSLLSSSNLAEAIAYALQDTVDFGDRAPSTTLEVYGAFRQHLSEHEASAMAVRLAAEGIRQSGVYTLPSTKEALDTLEMDLQAENEERSEDVVRRAGKDWAKYKGRMQFKLWDEAPPCPACGWSKETE